MNHTSLILYKNPGTPGFSRFHQDGMAVSLLCNLTKPLEMIQYLSPCLIDTL